MESRAFDLARAAGSVPDESNGECNNERRISLAERESRRCRQSVISARGVVVVTRGPHSYLHRTQSGLHAVSVLDMRGMRRRRGRARGWRDSTNAFRRVALEFARLPCCPHLVSFRTKFQRFRCRTKSKYLLPFVLSPNQTRNLSCANFLLLLMSSK